MGRRVLVVLASVAMLAAAAAPVSAAPAAVLGSLAVPGVAWAVDDRTGQVDVMIDETVTGARWEALRSAVAPLGDAVRIRREPGQLRTLIAGGQGIYSATTRCSLGANVRRGTTFFFVTAGHCTRGSTTWFADPTRNIVLGPPAGTSFPGNDYGIVQYSNPSISHPSAVFTHPGLVQATGTATGAIGQRVCRSGATTGVRCGAIVAFNATVNFPEGTVTGLIRTNICAEPGDSGGPLYLPASGGVVLIIGILVGGTGNCAAGGATFYQPIGEVLTAFNLTLP